MSSSSFGANLHSLSKSQFEQALVNKTLVSIATDNLNGKTIDNTFAMYMDDKGNIWGKMSHKPANEPQTDKGVYALAEDGTFYITWQHWDGAKKLCGHVFDTQNAYISVGCDGVFHTAFMKEAIQPGNHL
jgi:hypothetical protein